MKLKYLLLIFYCSSVLISQPSQIILGADKIVNEEKSLIAEKKIGIVTNHTAILSNGEHLIDALSNDPEIKVVVLFGPEHGIRGAESDGAKIQDTIDEKTGIPIYSLYGSRNKPTQEMLANVEILLFDIQDVGARFYTYLSTMILSMEAAAEKGIPFIILDRPNPIRGTVVDGPIRTDSLKSFVGWLPIPIQHGMTFGELASLANNSGWLKDKLKVDLKIIKFDGWRRSMWMDQTSLKWISPSPNMKSLKTATLYPGLCLIEGTNVSEGRGTENPFEIIGSPWINGDQLSSELNSYKIPGVVFQPKTFTPIDIPGVASNPKYVNEICNGVFIKVNERNLFQPVKTGIAILTALQKLYPQQLKFSQRRFDQLAGNSIIREETIKGNSYIAISSLWKKELDKFNITRNKYLLYLD